MYETMGRTPVGLQAFMLKENHMIVLTLYIAAAPLFTPLYKMLQFTSCLFRGAHAR